ncbi:MAG: peptide/nickel transport system substrate-binding protein [Acetobacteraceae bacterium]|nr:peptide/nickel transport system substrate-binding protein [Acetobacteraceae bacterium]
MPTRRRVLQSSLAALALPSIAKAASARVLKFIPQSDLAVIDPIWSTAYNARNHGYMVFDTLFGMDANSASCRRWSAACRPRRTATAGI